MKELLCTSIGVIGGIIANIFGGWDAGFSTLLIFMAFDYASGIAVAGIFKNSLKSENGSLKSEIGFKGICRKGMILVFVLVAYRLDLMLGTSYIRDMVVIAFITNELISLVENAGLMGIPIPSVIRKSIDILTKKSEGGFEDEHREDN